ncbi:MAG: ATP-dependent helicase [Chloroflexota bacterium]|nr:MAG: ATP-dependent helicase [Chloroflexota bacterium]
MKLRPAQRKILEYRGGRMAVSAVPGSGKTFTLSILAGELIRNERLNVAEGQQVLIVTYLNSGVETFRARIRQRLGEDGLPLAGYDVRTLHSLALEIIRISAGGSAGGDEGPIVLDEPQTMNLMAHATDSWIEANPQLWHGLLADDRPQIRVRWRHVLESTARTFIRDAKNHRYTAKAIRRQLRTQVGGEMVAGDDFLGDRNAVANEADAHLALLHILTGIYERYQSALDRLGASDFDDLIWRAAETLVNRPDVSDEFRNRWPFLLEDEAQDSVPLQEILLSKLAGPEGNWVRVGDPNQAITSTFTSAHPRHFNAFMEMPEVVALPLPNSGRCAPRIYGAANLLVKWVSESHPVHEVRANAFRRQEILPTPPGDAQPNPPDAEAAVFIKAYRHREEEELPAVARLAAKYARQQPGHTVAILTPTNDTGHKTADLLDILDAEYDNLLRGGSRVREIASALHWLLALMADPLDKKALEGVYASLVDLGHAVVRIAADVDHGRIQAILRSVHRPELLLYAESDVQRTGALPAGVTNEDEGALICRFAEFISALFRYRPLAVDDLILSLSDELFIYDGRHDQQIREADLATAYHLASAVRQWWDLQPDWRLPELAAQMSDIAKGRRRLHVGGLSESGYSPQPGRITLATQHSAKGMEWDAVFLVGIDSRWIPGDLDGHFIGVEAMIGGDPAAEATAQLHHLLQGADRLYPGRTATESAHIEVIAERLRLLYVGITRARRFLHISRSRQARNWQKEFDTEPVTVMGILYRYLKDIAG